MAKRIVLMKKGGTIATIAHTNGTTASYYVTTCTSCKPGKPCASHAVTIGTTTKNMCATPVFQNTKVVVNKKLTKELNILNSNTVIEIDIRTLKLLTKRIEKLNSQNGINS